MCLAIPAKILSIDGTMAEVDIAGVTRKASVQLTPEAGIGDFVLLHTGYALSIVSADEAAETMKILRELAETMGSEE
jgi:hydrogenase expression/formation protein HypC